MQRYWLGKGLRGAGRTIWLLPIHVQAASLCRAHCHVPSANLEHDLLAHGLVPAAFAVLIVIVQNAMSLFRHVDCGAYTQLTQLIMQRGAPDERSDGRECASRPGRGTGSGTPLRYGEAVDGEGEGGMAQVAAFYTCGSHMANMFEPSAASCALG